MGGGDPWGAPPPAFPFRGRRLNELEGLDFGQGLHAEPFADLALDLVR